VEEYGAHVPTDAGYQLERLIQVMAQLRGPGGCPWDQEQNLGSLRPYLIEEAYEVLEEMDRAAVGGSWNPLCEELGDLLFQVVFQAQLAGELRHFEMADVCRQVCEKLIRRHPHVFADEKVASVNEINQNWVRLKAREKKAQTGSEGSVLDGVPGAAPALLRAERLSEKASRIGFDWNSAKDVRKKVDEELGELDQALALGDRQSIEHELGDLLFALVNLGRFAKTPPEDALRLANQRFTTRFKFIEEALRREAVPFGQATLSQMESYWQQAKASEALVPPPKARRDARSDGLTLRGSPWLKVRAFWTSVARQVRWIQTSDAEEAVAFDTGSLHLRWVRSDELPGENRCSLHFMLPTRAEIDSLHLLLPQYGATKIDPPIALSADQKRYALRFLDPSGTEVEFAFSCPQDL
jgi:ATP diphosphatase